MRLKVSQEPPYFHTAKLSKTLRNNLMVFIWVQQANSFIPPSIPALLPKQVYKAKNQTKKNAKILF